MLSGEAQQSWGIITHVYLPIVAKKRSRLFANSSAKFHLLIAYCPFHHAMTNPKFLLRAIYDSRLQLHAHDFLRVP